MEEVWKKYLWLKDLSFPQLKDLKAENLVTLLKCKLSENNTDSKETWKLFFTKASAVLDQALVLLSNQVRLILKTLRVSLPMST
jgi:hypothetical protein